MAWAPLVGLALGGVAAAALVGVRAAAGGDVALLPAAIAVIALVVVTGALHIDGLADTADALGVRGDAAAARRAATDPGVGAFGVTAIAGVLVIDVTAVATASEAGVATAALVSGCAAGRLAATWACRSTPAAPDSTLGGWVAGTVSRRAAVAASVVTLPATFGVAALDASHRHVATAVAATLAVLAGLAVGAGVRRLGCRTFGGLTGDVLGAVICCASSTTYVVIACAGASMHA